MGILILRIKYGQLKKLFAQIQFLRRLIFENVEDCVLLVDNLLIFWAIYFSRLDTKCNKY